MASDDKKVHCILKNLYGPEIWFIIEGEMTEFDDFKFYGFTTKNPNELTHFYLSELAEFIHSGNGAKLECLKFDISVSLYNLLQKYKIPLNAIHEGDIL